MPRVALTDRTVASLPPTPGKQVDYFDERMPGFGVRVSPSGRRSWIVLYRASGRLRRLTLGRYPYVSLADARAKAKLTIGEVIQGGDPAAEKRVARCAETFAELATEYMEKHAKAKKRSWREDDRLINRNLLPVWRHLKAKDIARRDVRQVVETVLERGAPIQANRVFALVRKMFNFAIQRDVVEANPCLGLNQPAPNRQRDRVLWEEEIRAVWKAIELERPLIGATFKLRLLTAQRGIEILSMRWEHVDLANGWWTIPAELAKNGLSHRVPLSKEARTVLVAVKRLCEPGQAVFASPSVAGSMQYAQKAVERVRKASGVEFNGHDLRRTAASHMTSMGISRLVVAKILNHVERGVTAVYDRHSYDCEKREALDAWGLRLWEIVTSVENPGVRRGEGNAGARSEASTLQERPDQSAYYVM
jgi:integrase